MSTTIRVGRKSVAPRGPIVGLVNLLSRVGQRELNGTVSFAASFFGGQGAGRVNLLDCANGGPCANMDKCCGSIVREG